MNEGAPRKDASSDLVPAEEELTVIRRLQSGERAAFATLYGWYGDMLYRQVILPRLPVRELAEDCLRETFRKALENIGNYEPQGRSIWFWLRRIAINLAMDHYRRQRRDAELASRVQHEPERLASSVPHPERGIETEQTRRDVELSLSRMNERYARALRLRLIEDRSREECAEALGVTIGNFDVILHRAAKAFRKVYPP